jgi:sterol desaturase/sphingolipid hydroxylase (fatty acid hydroxylase superfamily)
MDAIERFFATQLGQFAPLSAWFSHYVIQLLLATGLSLVFLVAVFRPLEWAFPAKPGQKFFRPAWVTDLFFLLGQYLLWNALVFWCLVQSRGFLFEIVPGSFRAAVASLPLVLQILGVILLSDFCVYWGHRLQHRSEFLWRFHSVHHSAEHLDWLAAHREHPLDTVYTLTLINLPAFVLGFPLEALAGFIAFRGVWAIYIHSNVRLPLGVLRPILGAPELHHWHHAKDRDAGNYGNVCPLMDVIFGTYTCPDHEPESLGLNTPTPTTWLGFMVQPLLPKRRKSAQASAGAAETPSQLDAKRDSGMAPMPCGPPVAAPKGR